MRGEDLAPALTTLSQSGSPPHARGRPASDCSAVARARITPACAGKTNTEEERMAECWDHPRMRGEDAA